MTKKELWNELLEHNEEDFVCEICEEIPSYVLGIEGIIRDKYQMVWICKWCFFLGEDND